MDIAYNQKVEGALKSFKSPFRHYPRCPKCPLAKDMSLICLNQDCNEEFFQLICPYCHRHDHQQHQLKVEDDLDLVLQIIMNHTKNRLITKQVTDQDIQFVDVLLDSQKSLNRLLNKVQQVKFILDDTLAGYRRRMRNFEAVIQNVNNAQNSSSQQIINQQLKEMKQNIIYHANQTDVDIEWLFENDYSKEKHNREIFGTNCLNSIEQCYKTLNNLLINFDYVTKPILEKRLMQKVCLDQCNLKLSKMNLPWKVILKCITE